MSGQNNSSYLNYSWFLFGFVFLVILAGGVVRMTQSGMGCPDWPTCFGMWIPPTDASQLPADFEKYLSKQDIDHTFNVYHTWIEYINRLLGAILGLFILIYFFWSFLKFRKTNKKIVMLSFLLVLAVGVQGWLGKIVVDGNLDVFKITIHMIGALVIAALPLINIKWLNEKTIPTSRIYKRLLTLLIFLTLIQIILGTQVREEIDVISKALSYENRELWIGQLGNIFVVHRSFSWLILILSGYLYFASRSNIKLRKYSLLSFMNVIFIVFLGIVMAYLDIPAISQPLHLLFACGLVMLLFYTRIVLD